MASSVWATRPLAQRAAALEGVDFGGQKWGQTGEQASARPVSRGLRAPALVCALCLPATAGLLIFAERSRHEAVASYDVPRTQWASVPGFTNQ
eukprot:7099805-Prymnesium_polylepis.1